MRKPVRECIVHRCGKMKTARCLRNHKCLRLTRVYKVMGAHCGRGRQGQIMKGRSDNSVYGEWKEGSWLTKFGLNQQCDGAVRNVHEVLASVIRNVESGTRELIVRSVLHCSEYLWGCALSPGLQLCEVYLTIWGVLVGRGRMPW